MTPAEAPYHRHSPEDWWPCGQGWANEAQGDNDGLLNCGGATIVGPADHRLRVRRHGMAEVVKDGEVHDELEPHLVSYVRSALNIAGLRLLGNGHKESAMKSGGALIHSAPGRHPCRLPVWLQPHRVRPRKPPPGKSAQIAAEVLLKYPPACAGDKFIRSFATFTEDDQEKVNFVEPLSKYDSLSPAARAGIGRHALGSDGGV